MAWVAGMLAGGISRGAVDGRMALGALSRPVSGFPRRATGFAMGRPSVRGSGYGGDAGQARRHEGEAVTANTDRKYRPKDAGRGGGRGGGSVSAKTDREYRPKPKVLAPRQALPEDIDNALVYVDKPAGWTSFDVVGKVRGVMQLRIKDSFKVGHTGTLDPSATGIICLMLGRATKQSEALMQEKKCYTMTVHLGEGTPSMDKDTEVEEVVPWGQVTGADLRRAKEKWTGNVMQLPPMFSALRVNGERLYEAARRGEEVERERRQAIVHRLDVECLDEAGVPLGLNSLGDSEKVPSAQLRLDVEVSKGTYARTLAYDFAVEAGTVAHISDLRRTAIGDTTLEDTWEFDTFCEALVELKEKRKERGLKWGTSRVEKARQAYREKARPRREHGSREYASK